MTSNTWIIYKAITWQLLGLISMSFIGFMISGDWRTGGTMAVVSAIISFFTFMLHEKAWALALSKDEGESS